LSNLLNSVERLEVGLAVTFDVLEEAGSNLLGARWGIKVPSDLRGDRPSLSSATCDDVEGAWYNYHKESY
jgi:hypothetical protein